MEVGIWWLSGYTAEPTWLRSWVLTLGLPELPGVSAHGHGSVWLKAGMDHSMKTLLDVHTHVSPSFNKEICLKISLHEHQISIY